MNMQILCLLAVLFTNLIIGIGIILAFMYMANITKEDTKLKTEMFLFSLPINDTDNFMVLDNMIRSEVETYEIYNFPSYGDTLYITEEEQNKMVKCILSNVLKKLSPIYLNKLKYIYNESVLEDIIFGKVRDAVLNFSIEINGQFKDKEKK